MSLRSLDEVVAALDQKHAEDQDTIANELALVLFPLWNIMKADYSLRFARPTCATTFVAPCARGGGMMVCDVCSVEFFPDISEGPEAYCPHGHGHCFARSWGLEHDDACPRCAYLRAPEPAAPEPAAPDMAEIAFRCAEVADALHWRPGRFQTPWRTTVRGDDERLALYGLKRPGERWFLTWGPGQEAGVELFLPPATLTL